MRTTDIFFHDIDLDRIGVPHADVQMRLFARMVTDLLADAAPIPRLWYFPGANRTLMVLTADAHTQDPSPYQALLAAVAARGGQLTVYLARGLNYPTAADASAWRATGTELGMHPYAFADGLSLEEGYQDIESWFTRAKLGRPQSNRATTTLSGSVGLKVPRSPQITTLPWTPVSIRGVPVCGTAMDGGCTAT